MAMSKKQKRPRESSTSSGEGGVQRHIKRPAPFETNLQNLQINGTAGYFTLDDVRQVVREAMESANSYLIALIDSRIENATSGFIPEIHSLKSAIPELVREGIEHAVSHIKQVERPPPKCTEIADVRNMQLCFKSKLSLPLYTGMKLEGYQGCPIQVELIDANTDHVVTSGPASSAKLDVVVLKGDFNKEDNNTWTLEEFEHSVVKEREGKRPLLTGKLHVNLVDGVGELGDLSFTDNSSWNSSKKFRIGVQVASGFCAGIRVQEAVTEAFTVKDHRGESYKKHHPPAANDEVWRLENIAKDGEYHKRLNKEGIRTVEEFLRSLAGDSKKLRNILGNGMTKKRWIILIEHANSCCPNKKSYVYYRHDKKNDGVVTNNLCQLKGLIIGGDYYPTEQLSESQQVDADNLVKAASKNWNRVMEFNAESSSTPMLNQLHGNPSDSRLTPSIFPRTQSYGVPQQSLVPVSEDATVGFPNVNHEHSDGIIPESLILSDNTNLTNNSLEQDTDPWNLQETFGNENFHYTEPHESSPLYLPRPSPPFEGGYFMEELWSSSAYDDFGGNIMPENVDMQNLSNNIGVASSSNQHVGRNFRNGNGRGVVCWFKVKAIFRWGFFKRVSERLVELD